MNAMRVHFVHQNIGAAGAAMRAVARPIAIDRFDLLARL